MPSAPEMPGADLEAYKADLQKQVEHYKASSSQGLEHWKAAREVDRIAYRAIVDFAISAIKLLVLVNGGAVLATLTFLGNLVTRSSEFHSSAVNAVALTIKSFAVGLMAGLVAAAASYVAQVCFFELSVSRRRFLGKFFSVGRIARGGDIVGGIWQGRMGCQQRISTLGAVAERAGAAMPTIIADATYNEVMLDWAVAELCSPTWEAYWRGPDCDALRSKVALAGLATLTVSERTALVAAIVQRRSPLISKFTYGPYPSWMFWRATVDPQELSQFSIASSFPYPTTFNFGDFAIKIRDNPSPAERSMRADAMALQKAAEQGKAPIGLPLAINRSAPMSPLLVEGYKRSMVALWSRAQSIEMFLCSV